jgi:CP family cyanate transporter-like MFS transporter
MTAPRASAWLVIWVGVSAAMHVGKLPPTLPVLREQLDMSLLQAGFLLSMVQTAGMLLGVLVGLGADRLGLRRCMLLGVCLLSLSSVVGGAVTDVATMLVLRALEGLGFLMATMPAPALIRRLVQPSQLQRMMGYWGAYMPLGTALALLLAPWVIGISSWPVVWWGLGVWLWLSGLMVWWWVPADDDTAAIGAAMNPWRQRLASVLTHRGPWLVVLSFAVYSGQWLAIIGFLPSIYVQMGLSMATGGTLTAAVAAANMGGNIYSGRLLSRGINPPALLRWGFGAMGVGAFLAFAQWQSWQLPATLQFVCVVCFSALGGVIPGTLFSLAVRLAPGEDTVATTVGWVQQWSSIGQFAGPPLVAWMAAATGGWQWTWVVTGSFCLVGWWLAGQVRTLLNSTTQVSA